MLYPENMISCIHLLGTDFPKRKLPWQVYVVAEQGLAWNTHVQRPVTGRVHFRLRRCFSEGACIEYI